MFMGSREFNKFWFLLLFQGPKTYFLDTLSLHMCISGFTSLQRSLWESANAGRIGKVPWMLVGSGNKLTNLHQLYCGSDGVDKSLVKIFVEGSLDDVKENFQVSNISTYMCFWFSILWVESILKGGHHNRWKADICSMRPCEMMKGYCFSVSFWTNYVCPLTDNWKVVCIKLQNIAFPPTAKQGGQKRKAVVVLRY